MTKAFKLAITRARHDTSVATISDAAIGPDGAAYVTNFGIVPGRIPQAFSDGTQVLRISLY